MRQKCTTIYGRRKLATIQNFKGMLYIYIIYKYYILLYTMSGRDQFFFLLEIFFRHLRVCYFVAPSLLSGRISNLLLLLVPVSTFILYLYIYLYSKYCQICTGIFPSHDAALLISPVLPFGSSRVPKRAVITNFSESLQGNVKIVP
jgi:hypothetical protein